MAKFNNEIITNDEKIKRNSNRRFIFRMVVRLIRKYFPEGVSVITDYKEDIIGYKWAWTNDLEDECFKKRKTVRR